MWVTTKIFLVLFVVFFASSAQAAVIFPSVIDVSAMPGESQQIKIDVKNTDLDNRSYLVEMVGVDLGQEEGDYTFYNLDETKKAFFSINTPEFLLVSQEEREIEIDFSPSQEATSETFIAGVQIIEEPEVGGQIYVRTGIMSLLFVTLGGDIQYDVRWTDFQTSINAFTGEINSYLTIENTGSGILQPDGVVRVTDILGRVRDESILNTELRRIPAGQIRTFSIYQELPWAIGPYKLDLYVKPWPGADVYTTTETIWLCSWRVVALFVGLMLMIAIVLGYVRRH
ncbi:MAG: hypothetical protein ABIA83_00835 [Patescibacteria group bacterium]